MMRRDWVVVTALVGASLASHIQYVRAKKRYERMIVLSSSRMKLMLDLNSRLQHLRRQRERLLTMHGTAVGQHCRECGTKYPCETFTTIWEGELT